MFTKVPDRLSQVHKRVAELTGRPHNQAVEIVAISKRQPMERILSALESGHRIFGENRVEDAKKKWPLLRNNYPDVILHLVGNLQSNKVKAAVALFDVIQTIDRLSIARKISAEITIQRKNVICFVQINTGNETQKLGIKPEEAVDFVSTCRGSLNLDIRGFMCIPPISDNPALHFAFLRELAGRAKVKDLSMGMSSDFETAIELGATHIRLGTLIFGDRLDSKSLS